MFFLVMYRVKYLLIFLLILQTQFGLAQGPSGNDKSLNSSQNFKGREKKNIVKSKKKTEGFTVQKKNNKKDSPDQNKVAQHTIRKRKFWVTIRDFVCVKCRESKTDCPDKTDRKSNAYDFNANTSINSATKANLVRSTNSVHFDVVQLEDIHLDIPAFKQFKNNMTDFTADGEHEFQKIIQKIGVYLGTNYEGKGVTLKITGSASQIPTSFDPSLPNNNINPDGSSIIGRTSIAHNRKLAKARADELAKKIIAVFPSIQIMTPKLEDIELGPTKWTKECQLELSKYFSKGDKAGMKMVYEPFQKDQWVKVESKEKTSKSIQPESIRMYMISTTPQLKKEINGETVTIKSVFIVSKQTYDLIGDNKSFNSIEERDAYLEKLGLEIYYESKNGIARWFLLNGNNEISAFNTQNYEQKVYNLYLLGIVDKLDEEILEQRIINDLAKVPEN